MNHPIRSLLLPITLVLFAVPCVIEAKPLTDDEQIKEMTKIINHESGSYIPGGLPKAYVVRGAARVNKGDIAGGIDDLTHAIELHVHPFDAEAYSNRGDAKVVKGDLDDAIADYTHAIELSPDNATRLTHEELQLHSG